MKVIAAFLSLVLMGSAVSAEPAPVKATGAITAGLELPPDQTVDTKEGFVLVQAKSKGEVKFLVVSKNKIKYLVYPASVVVSIPPEPGTVIDVYAVAVVDGRVTDFVKTTITVGSVPVPPGPNPPDPNPNPPNPAAKAWNVVFIVDSSKATPELAKILNSPTLRETINQRGHWFRLYDINADNAKKYRYDVVAREVMAKYPGTANIMIIQSPNGVVRPSDARPVPASEAEILNVINHTIR